MCIRDRFGVCLKASAPSWHIMRVDIDTELSPTVGTQQQSEELVDVYKRQADEGVMGAREVIENDLIKELDVYKDGKIVYFIEHANVWYTSTGGVQALDTMLSDLESALLN